MKSLSSLCLDSFPRASCQNWLKRLQISMLLLSAFLFATGWLIEDPVFLTLGVFSAYGFGLCYICRDLYSRIILLFLFAGIFLFWLTRPLIGMVYRTDAWLGSTFESTVFALGAIYLSIVFLVAGSTLYERMHFAPLRVTAVGEKGSSARDDDSVQTCGLWRRFTRCDYLTALRSASLLIYAFCFVCAMIYGIQMLSYMKGLTYEEFYLTSTTAYASSTLSSLADLAPAALCALLATMPRRSVSTIVLFANILTTIPKLIIGGRTDFVLAVLFLAFYYMVRNAREGKGSWISKREIALVLLAIPVGIVLLGAINYLRAGGGSSPQGIMLRIADTLYKQGVTFKVLEYGYDVNPLVSELGFKFYSLGPLLTTVTQGFVGQLFLGCELLPDVNSVPLATKGFYYAHTMSFFAHPNYLGGESYGSSYILELFADFGFGGIVVGSLVLGFLFTAMANLIGRGWLSTTIILMAARKVFHVPRGEFAEWAECLWSTRFWLVVVAIVLLALIMTYLIQQNKSSNLRGYGFPSFMTFPLSGELRSLRYGRESISKVKTGNSAISVLSLDKRRKGKVRK